PQPVYIPSKSSILSMSTSQLSMPSLVPIIPTPTSPSTAPISHSHIHMPRLTTLHSPTTVPSRSAIRKEGTPLLERYPNIVKYQKGSAIRSKPDSDRLLRIRESDRDCSSEEVSIILSSSLTNSLGQNHLRPRLAPTSAR